MASRSSTGACWIRIPLEKVCCSHECRPVCRSSVFEHICSVLERTGPTHIYWLETFHYRPSISASPLYAPVSFGSASVSPTAFRPRGRGSLRSTHRGRPHRESPPSFASGIKRKGIDYERRKPPLETIDRRSLTEPRVYRCFLVFEDGRIHRDEVSTCISMRVPLFSFFERRDSPAERAKSFLLLIASCFFFFFTFLYRRSIYI